VREERGEKAGKRGEKGEMEERNILLQEQGEERK
jgi:hypothetical protein